MLDVLRKKRDNQRAYCRACYGSKQKESHSVADDVLLLHASLLLNLDQSLSVLPATLEIVVVALPFPKDVHDNLAVV